MIPARGGEVRMAEYIDRQLCEIVAEYDKDYRLVVPLSKIRRFPTSDVAPVVRCKECNKSSYDEKFGNRWCNRTLSCVLVKDDDFCSYGKRSTEISTEK